MDGARVSCLLQDTFLRDTCSITKSSNPSVAPRASIFSSQNFKGGSHVRYVMSIFHFSVARHSFPQICIKLYTWYRGTMLMYLLANANTFQIHLFVQENMACFSWLKPILYQCSQAFFIRQTFLTTRCNSCPSLPSRFELVWTAMVCNCSQKWVICAIIFMDATPSRPPLATIEV